jgi:hypothetical protein
VPHRRFVREDRLRLMTRFLFSRRRGDAAGPGQLKERVLYLFNDCIIGEPHVLKDKLKFPAVRNSFRGPTFMVPPDAKLKLTKKGLPRALRNVDGRGNTPSRSFWPFALTLKTFPTWGGFAWRQRCASRRLTPRGWSRRTPKLSSRGGSKTSAPPSPASRRKTRRLGQSEVPPLMGPL